MHVVPFRKLLEEAAACGLDPVGQAGLRNLARGDRGHVRQVEHGRTQRPMLFAKLDVVRTRSAADVQEAAELPEIHRFAELARGHRGKRMHRLPEERQHRWILAIERRGLHCRVPCGRPVRAQRLCKPVPARVEPLVGHLHEATEVIRLPAHEIGFAQGRIAVTSVRLLQKPERGATGQQHLGWTRMQVERFRQPGNRDAGAARETAEKVQLMRSGQSLEGPETGRERHQWNGGRKLRRGDNRLDVCLPGRRRSPRKLAGHDHLFFQNESRPATGWLVRCDSDDAGVTLRFQK